MSITCRQLQQLQDVYLDGDLSASLTAEVHAHLLQCPECQQQVEMMRACGDVIAHDRSEPSLDAEFAARVAAALPGAAAYGPAPMIETRRERRLRRWRVALGGAAPAIAASLFFCMVVWPGSSVERQTRFVAGQSAVNSVLGGVVDPTVDAVGEGRRAVTSLNNLYQIAVGDARDQMSASVKRARSQTEKPGESGLSWMDVLFAPFTDALEQSPGSTNKNADNSGVVRF